MSVALAFSRHLHPVTAAPGRPDGAVSQKSHPAIPVEREAFVAAYGGVVEHSPWVAEAAWGDGPFRDATALHAAFERALLGAPRDAQVAVLRAHPELAAARAIDPATLTAESASEQAGAGLDRLGEARRVALAAALTEYRERFDFPFIACVRDHGGATLEDLVASRLPAEPEAELTVALGEVSRIARHRLVDLVEGV